MVDKLGEEIAFDINSLETTQKQHQAQMQEIRIQMEKQELGFRQEILSCEQAIAKAGKGAASVPSAGKGQTATYLKALCNPSEVPEGVQSSEVNYLISLIDKQLKVHCSEDRMKAISRNSISDLKFRYKKLKDDQKYLLEKYDRIKSKLKDNNRLLDKIRANSLRGHGSRSASKHREMEYLSIRKFGRFLTFLKQSLEGLVQIDEEAHERDLKLV